MPLEIINNARTYVRASTINSLSDTSDDALEIIAEFRKAVRWLMERSEWVDLTATICPNELPEPECCDIPNGFNHAFHLPDDFVRLVSVCPQYDDSDYKVGTLRFGLEEQVSYNPDNISHRIVKIGTGSKRKRVLVTDCAPIKVEYICAPSDEDFKHMSQAMRDVLTYRLAEVFANTVKSDDGDVKKYREMGMEAMKEARRLNMQHHNENDRLPDGFIVEGRCW